MDIKKLRDNSIEPDCYNCEHYILAWTDEPCISCTHKHHYLLNEPELKTDNWEYKAWT